MNATTNIQTGEREAQSSSVRPVIDERQRQLAHETAIRIGGHTEYAAKVERSILQALAAFGGQLIAYQTTGEPTAYATKANRRIRQALSLIAATATGYAVRG